MIHPETHQVTAENGPRPAGRDDECFYCHQPIGMNHAPDCVCRKRTIKLKLTTEVVIDVPEYWDESNINFYYNESSHCTDNVLHRLVKRYGLDTDELSEHECSCFVSNIEFVGEADEEDDRRWGLGNI